MEEVAARHGGGEDPTCQSARPGCPSGSESKLPGLYFSWAGFVLFTSAVAKLVTAGGSNPLLEMSDPVLLIPTRQMLILVSVVEICVCWQVLSRRTRQFLKAVSISWLGWCFLSYKALLWFREPDRPCNCLGWLGRWLGISEELISRGTTAVAALFLVGGLWVVIRSLKARRST